MARHWHILVAAAVVCVVLLLLQALLRGDPSRRNWEIFTEMAYSVAGESFAESPAMPGGRVLQVLPEGVVLQGEEPFLYGPGDEEAVRAGAELQNPFADDDAAVLKEGAQIYARYCVVCHDPAGEGRGSVVARGMVPPPPFQAVTAMEMKDGQMFHILTRGRSNMASYAAQLTDDERWKVIRFIRSLQEQP